MPNRKHPVVIAGRFDQREVSLIEAAIAVNPGRSKSDLVREGVLPKAREWIESALDRPAASAGDPCLEK